MTSADEADVPDDYKKLMRNSLVFMQAGCFTE
jgi:hypothetical protein